MDPFNQVFSDAESQLQHTEQLLGDYQSSLSSSILADLNNSVQELVETIHDLSQSIGAVQAQPSQFGLSQHDIDGRINQVGKLNTQLSDIQQRLANTRQETAATAASIERAGTDEEQTIGGQNASQNNMQLAMVLEEQDTMLDSVYHTVNSLREQANVMGRELEDQSYLIEDFDRQVDTAQDKIRRGLKRVDWVLKNNRETLSSCCITLLILILIILLVLVLVL